MPSELRRIILASCLIQFVVTLSMTFVNAFLTLFIYQDLGVPSLKEAALWSGIGTFMGGALLAISSPLWGWMTDRYGAKKMMVRVLVTHSIITGMMAFAPDVPTILLLRSVRGLLGGVSVVAMAAIASAAGKDDLAGALGYQQSALLLGGVLGPLFGGFAAPFIGFRACFLISSVSIACVIPFVLALDWPGGGGGGIARPSLRGLAGLHREFSAMLLVRASLAFLGPILPVYLRSAGVGVGDLTLYTGIILAVSDVAFAASVPITSRRIPMRGMPMLLVLQSGAILGQGFLISLPSLVFLRAGQGILHSAVPTQLFSLVTQGRSEKGTAIGLMSSARFLGGAMSPVAASTVNYYLGLPAAFGCMAVLSLAAAGMTWVVVSSRSGRRVDGDGGAAKGYIHAPESGGNG